MNWNRSTCTICGRDYIAVFGKPGFIPDCRCVPTSHFEVSRLQATTKQQATRIAELEAQVKCLQKMGMADEKRARSAEIAWHDEKMSQVAEEASRLRGAVSAKRKIITELKAELLAQATIIGEDIDRSTKLVMEKRGLEGALDRRQALLEIYKKDLAATEVTLGRVKARHTEQMQHLRNGSSLQYEADMDALLSDIPEVLAVVEGVVGIGAGGIAVVQAKLPAPTDYPGEVTVTVQARKETG